MTIRKDIEEECIMLILLGFNEVLFFVLLVTDCFVLKVQILRPNYLILEDFDVLSVKITNISANVNGPDPPTYLSLFLLMFILLS